jgi:hypothetical protein
MAQFLADIAGMLEIIAIAAGLVLLHVSFTRPPAALLKAAGVLLLVGGLAVGACTTWYWLGYHRDGAFAVAGEATCQPLADPAPLCGPDFPIASSSDPDPHEVTR